MNVKKAISFAAMAVLLGACGGQQGVGFTGLSAEPVSVSRAQGAGSNITGGTSYVDFETPAVGVELNPRKARREARQAFDAPTNAAVQVRVEEQTMFMNVVEVNGRQYAVLRPPAGRSLSPNVGDVFRLNARALTFCQQSGPFYGERDGPGVATALACG